jgi:hypothetical protein
LSSQRWKKFGDVSGKPPGPEPGITTLGDEIHFVLGKKTVNTKYDMCSSFCIKWILTVRFVNEGRKEVRRQNQTRES